MGIKQVTDHKLHKQMKTYIQLLYIYNSQSRWGHANSVLIVTNTRWAPALLVTMGRIKVDTHLNRTQVTPTWGDIIPIWEIHLTPINPKWIKRVLLKLWMNSKICSVGNTSFLILANIWKNVSENTSSLWITASRGNISIEEYQWTFPAK